MTTTPQKKLGFLSASGRPGSQHYDDFLAFIPAGLEVQIQPLGLYDDSLDQLKGKVDAHVSQTAALVRERGWDGVALLGAPMEVENPGFIDRIRAAIPVPATTALGASAAALRALSVRKTLLLSPFNERLKGMLRDHLAGEGIDAVLPSDAFASIPEAMSATADEVFEFARDRFAKAPGVEAVYFQGAPLNPLLVIERLEAELGVPVVASNPAMLWHLTSMMGLSFSVPDKGRLLREWPALVTA